MKDIKSCEEIKQEKFAPGMDEEELEREATRKEKKCGEATRVTEFSWDEVDPS